jgi:hypothetical protein
MAQMPEWMEDLVRNVGDRAVRDIVNDARRGDIHARASAIPGKPPTSTVRPLDAGPVKDGSDAPVASTGTGWAESPQVNDWKPPGLSIMDRMMDQADALDRAERIRALAQSAAIKRAEAEIIKQQEELSKKQKGPKA